jgi:hypothetical protein
MGICYVNTLAKVVVALLHTPVIYTVTHGAAALCTEPALNTCTFMYLIHPVTPLLALLTVPLLTSLLVLHKWLLLGRVHTNTPYPMRSFFVSRWFLVFRLKYYVAQALTPYYEGTPLVAWIYRLLGSRVGSRVRVANLVAPDYDQVKRPGRISIRRDGARPTAGLLGSFLWCRPQLRQDRSKTGSATSLQPTYTV